ncbi:MAG: peptidase sortase [Parcubacteria group bacterium]|nr:peptidase sortase [Parcubacteria group bacterium]
MNTSTKRTIGIGIILLALLTFGYTLFGSVFYAANEDSRTVSFTPVAVEANTIAVAEREVVTASTSTKPSTAVIPPKPKPIIAPKPVVQSAYPTRLAIPSLGIDANVQHVGINAKGNMATPNNFTDVSWYKPGTVPGEIGSAVMAGHVDNGLALSGVFKHLEDLKPGDDVYVTRGDGTTLHFRVDEAILYPYQDVPTSSVFTSADGIHLNLVTCTGDWVPGQKTYDQRLVVYTTLVK